MDRWIGLFIGFGSLLLAACESQQALQAHARSLNDRALCMSWMTRSNFNQYSPAMAAEIRSRGLDCWKYGNVAEEKRRAEAGLQQSIQNLGNALDRRAPAPASGAQGVDLTRCIDRGQGVLTCTSATGATLRCQSRGAGVVNCSSF